MSRFILGIPLLALIVGGCNDDDQDNSISYSETQVVKPIVSIVPVIDHTQNEYSWNLSDELSCTIYNRIAWKDHIAVNKASQVRNKVKQIKESQNPFGSDISWTKKVFPGDQFVVFLELVEHEEVPKINRKKMIDLHNTSAKLNMSMRVRVLDLRREEPKIILQELVHDSHFIPRPLTQANFLQVEWGDDGFSVSPIGLAHAEFTKQIASRIDKYIMTAFQQK
jgi:hypothetical protein